MANKFIASNFRDLLHQEFLLIFKHAGWMKRLLFCRHFHMHFLMKKLWNLIKISLKCGGLIDDKSTLVEIMAWCCVAAGHYLNQWWPRSMIPYGVTKPQWVKLIGYDNTLNELQNGFLHPKVCAVLIFSSPKFLSSLSQISISNRY